MANETRSALVYTESSWALLAGMRFVLAMIVFLSHLSFFVPKMPPVLDFVWALDGKAAVIGFLLISGVSIGASYRQRPEGYYARRFLRIYPLYFFAVALTQSLVYSLGSPYNLPHGLILAAGWKTGLGNFLLLQDFAVIPNPYNGSLWTLSIEVFLYLWVPLLARVNPWVIIGLIVASMAMFLLCNGGLVLCGYLAARYAWPWLIGFLLAYNGWSVTTVVFAVATACLPPLHRVEFGGWLCWFTVSATAVVLWTASRVSLPARVRTVLDFLGEQSYPLYLFHLPLALALYQYAGLRNYWALAAGILPVTVALDYLLDHWLKDIFWKPLIKQVTGLGRARITSAVATAS